MFEWTGCDFTLNGSLLLLVGLQKIMKTVIAKVESHSGDDLRMCDTCCRY